MTLAFERIRSSRPALLALALALSVTPRARAQAEVDSETRSIARELALQGADAFEREDYATALDRLQRAATLFRAPSILVMLARSLSRMGRFLEALDRYEETQRLLLPADAPEAFRVAVDDARSEARALRARLPYVEVRTGTTTHQAGLNVLLDGRKVSDALLNVERPVDPGAHQLDVAAPGFASFHQDFTLGEGERRSIMLPKLTPLSSPSPSATRASEPSGARTSPWVFALGGVGMASLGVGVATGLVALNHKSELDAQCHPGCPASARDDIDSFRLNRTASYVSIGLGTAALGTAAYLWFTSSKRSASLAAGVTPAGVSLAGAF